MPATALDHLCFPLVSLADFSWFWCRYLPATARARLRASEDADSLLWRRLFLATSFACLCFLALLDPSYAFVLPFAGLLFSALGGSMSVAARDLLCFPLVSLAVFFPRCEYLMAAACARLRSSMVADFFIGADSSWRRLMLKSCSLCVDAGLRRCRSMQGSS